MSITINKNTIMQYGGSIHSVNVVFDYRGYTVSLCLDDSCGNKEKLFRGDFAIIKDTVDVSAEFFPDYTENNLIYASSQVLKEIFLSIDMKLDSAAT